MRRNILTSEWLRSSIKWTNDQKRKVEENKAASIWTDKNTPNGCHLLLKSYLSTLRPPSITNDKTMVLENEIRNSFEIRNAICGVR